MFFIFLRILKIIFSWNCGPWWFIQCKTMITSLMLQTNHFISQYLSVSLKAILWPTQTRISAKNLLCCFTKDKNLLDGLKMSKWTANLHGVFDWTIPLSGKPSCAVLNKAWSRLVGCTRSYFWVDKNVHIWIAGPMIPPDEAVCVRSCA